MNNENLTKTLHSYIGPFIIIVLAVCIYLAHRYTSTSPVEMNGEPVSSHCEFKDNSCFFRVMGYSSSAFFSTNPEVEEEVTISFVLPPHINITSVWIEGVNMYMGKIPVLVEHKGQGVWSGWFMLGSCTEPSMQWRMIVNIEGQQQPATLDFYTHY